MESTITLPVQINGKKRAEVTVARDAGKDDDGGCRFGPRCGKKGARRQEPEKGHCRPAEDRQCGGLRPHPALDRRWLPFWRCRPHRRLLPAALWRPRRGRRRPPRLDNKLAGVEVAPVNAPNGTPLARVGGQMRNDLIYDLTGGGGEPPRPPTGSTSACPPSQLSGDRRRQHRAARHPELRHRRQLHADRSRTGKVVINGQTFSRVSYNIPGQEQRFAGARGLRDAENRAAKVIADNIHSRLASYFRGGDVGTRRALASPLPLWERVASPSDSGDQREGAIDEDRDRKSLRTAPHPARCSLALRDSPPSPTRGEGLRRAIP